MSFSSFHLDPPNCNLLPASAGAGSGAGAGGGDAGLASAQVPGVLVSAARPTVSTAKRPQLTKLPPPEQPLRCPRCDSTNTKFCYYNNYSLSQPRHFCKACRRYWTRGGTLRSVPVGGACHRRRNRSAESSSSTSSKPSAHAGVLNSLAPKSGGTPTINSNGAAAGRQIELWNLPQVQHLAFFEPAAQQPATLALPHFQAGVNLPPVKMEDHASHLGFNLPRQFSVPPGNYHHHNWSSNNGMKDGYSGGGAAAAAGGGGWATMADLYVFDSSSISGFNINNYL